MSATLSPAATAPGMASATVGLASSLGPRMLCGAPPCATSVAAIAADVANVASVLCMTRVWLRRALDLQHGAGIRVGQQVEQTVRTLAHVANALLEILEEKLSTNHSTVVIEDDAFEP